MFLLSVVFNLRHLAFLKENQTEIVIYHQFVFVSAFLVLNLFATLYHQFTSVRVTVGEDACFEASSLGDICRNPYQVSPRILGM